MFRKPPAGMLKSPKIILLIVLLGLFGPVIFLDASYAPPRSTSFGITDFVEEAMTPLGSVQPRNLPRYYTADPLGVRHSYGLDRWILDSLAKYEIPFWNPYQLTGQPLLAAYWYAPLYPLNWLRLILPESFWDWYYYLHVLLFAFFAYLIAQTISQSAFASICAALAAVTLGAVSNYLPMLEMTTAMPWGAAILFAFVKISTGIYGRRHLLLTMVATAFFGLSGHPTVAIFWLFGFAIFSISFLLASRNILPKPIVAFFIFGCFGAVLAAPNIGPFLEYVTQPDTLTIFPEPRFFNFRDFVAINFPNVLGRLNNIDSGLPGNSPGHLALIPVFLVPLLIGFRAAVARRHPVILAMSVTAFVLAAWSFGLFPFTYISELPFLRRLTFTYSWIVIGLYLAIISSFGIKELQELSRARLIGEVTKCSVFYVVLLSIAAAYVGMSDAGLGQLVERNRFSIVLVLVQLIIFWPIAAALIDTRHDISNTLSTGETLTVFALTCFAIIYMPNGNPEGIRWTQSFMLGAAAAVIAIAFMPGNSVFTEQARTATAFLIFLSAHLIVFSQYPGLPGRWAKPDIPEYLSEMTDTLRDYRFYGVEGAIPLNNLGRFGVSSINNLSVLTPSGVNAFYRNHLDKYAPTAQFYGHAHYPPEAPGAVSNYIANRKYWEYIGVRYLAIPLAWPLVYAKEDGARAVHQALSTASDIEDAGKTVPATLNKVDPQLAFAQLGSTAHKPVPLPARRATLVGRLACSELSDDSSLFIRVSTYGKPVEGSLELSLVRGMEVVRTLAANKDKIRDNRFTEFKIPGLACKKNATEKFDVMLEYVSARRQPLALWRSEQGAVDWYLTRKARHEYSIHDTVALINKFGVKGKLDCKTAIEAVSIRFGKYGNQGAGQLLIALWPENTEEQGEVFRREVSTLRESAYAHIKPQRNICASSPGRLNVGVVHLAPDDVGPVAVFQKADTGELVVSGHYVNPQQNVEDFRLVTRDFEGQIAVIENLRAEPRAYFTRAYRQAADMERARTEFASLNNLRSVAIGEAGADYCASSFDEGESAGGGNAATITEIGPNKLTLDFDASAPGTVVVTDTFYPGWSAKVNGVGATVQRINGYFLGVCIPTGGRYSVELQFQPSRWPLLISVSIASSLVFLLFLVFYRVDPGKT